MIEPLEHMLEERPGSWPIHEPVPREVGQLKVVVPGLLTEAEAAWLIEPARRCRLIEAVRAISPDLEGDPVAAGALSLCARYLLSVAATPGWSRVFGHVLATVRGFVAACDATVDRARHLRRDGSDVCGRLARAALDRSLLEFRETPRVALLELAERWCEADRRLGRAGWLTELQIARLYLCRGAADQARGQVEATYRSFGDAHDGFSHLAHVHIAWRQIAAGFDLLMRDLAEGRQTRDSTLVFAVLLAAHGQRDRAREVVERHVAPGADGADRRVDIAARVLPLLEPTWLRCGLTRRLRETLEWCLAILPEAPREPGGADRWVATAARSLTLLGRDGVVRDTCSGSGGLGAGVADSLAMLLCRAGYPARARGMLAYAGDAARVAPPPQAELLARVAEDRFSEARALALSLNPAERAKVELAIVDRLEGRWAADEPWSAASRADSAACRAGLMHAIEHAVASVEVRLGLIRAEWLSGRVEAAVDAVLSWYATDQRAGDGFARLAAMQARARRYDEALALLERDRSIHRMRAGSSLAVLARCQAALGRLSEASATLDHVHEFFPSLPGAAGEAVRAATDLWSPARPRQGDAPQWDSLEALCRVEIERRRDTWATHLGLARCRALRGDAEGAAQAIAHWYAQDYHEADLRWDVGRFLTRAGLHAEFDRMARLDLADGRLGERRVRQWVETLVRSGRTGEALGVVALADRSERDPAELRGALHAVDPYLDFDHQSWPEDLQGWHSKSPLFEELIREVRPRLIVEVGTWKGGSAVHMAECCRRLGWPTVILCVDTWLGAVEFWMNRNDASRYGALALKHGYPTVYYQFLANCRHRSHEDRIVPYPQTSTNAARWLLFEGFSADLIYVDASHVREDVAADIMAYWKILRPGGVLFGDDHAMPDVAEAVSDFARSRGLAPSVAHGQWVLRKPPSAAGRPGL